MSQLDLFDRGIPKACGGSGSCGYIGRDKLFCMACRRVFPVGREENAGIYLCGVTVDAWWTAKARGETLPPRK